MSIPGSANPLFFSAAAAVGDFKVDRSLRFNSNDTARLTRTPSSAGNTNTYTISFWMKLAKLGTNRTILSARQDTGNFVRLYLTTGNRLIFEVKRSSSTVVNLSSRGALRDPAAWYHVVVSSQSGSQKLYINNGNAREGESPIAESSATDTGSTELNDTQPHAIGAEATTNNDPFDGYLAEIHFVDGTAHTPGSFAEHDENGNWNPKNCQSDLSYGTNGFYLKFNDDTSTTTISEDSSGNNNDWSATGISVSGTGTDSLIDTPTNYEAGSGNNGGNYATLNPLDGNPSGLSNGNLHASSDNAYPTIIPGSGQWYYEVNGTGYTWDGTRSNFTRRSGSHNFGQRPFSGTPNANHVSVCTTNLTDPTIADGSTFMDVRAYTGNGTTKTIDGLNHQPDLVWIKHRTNSTEEHKLTDSVRGVTQKLASNSRDAEGTNANGLTAFNEDGFTVGSATAYNTLNQTHVAWSWAKSTDARFSIVEYSGTGSTQTVSHGLNTKPYLILVKRTNLKQNWSVYSQPTTADEFLRLNSDRSSDNSTAHWNDTEPTNSVFTVRSNDTVNASGGQYVAYCWAPIEGYSSIGSYTGQGSTGGFVYTGFRPRWIMIKRTSGTGDWHIFDTSRDGYNPDNDSLIANDDRGEITTDFIDILSNGFKLRSTSIDLNGSSPLDSYLYVSFAEHPFKTARAR